MKIANNVWRVTTESTEEPAWFQVDGNGFSVARAHVLTDVGAVLAENAEFRLEPVTKREQFFLSRQMELQGILIRLATLDDPLDDLPELRASAAELYREWNRAFKDDLCIDAYSIDSSSV